MVAVVVVVVGLVGTVAPAVVAGSGVVGVVATVVPPPLPLPGPPLPDATTGVVGGSVCAVGPWVLGVVGVPVRPAPVEIQELGGLVPGVVPEAGVGEDPRPDVAVELGASGAALRARPLEGPVAGPLDGTLDDRALDDEAPDDEAPDDGAAPAPDGPAGFVNPPPVAPTRSPRLT